jgi:hypothetical protein
MGKEYGQAMDRWDLLEYGVTIAFIAACILIGAFVLPWY